MPFCTVMAAQESPFTSDRPHTPADNITTLYRLTVPLTTADAHSDRRRIGIDPPTARIVRDRVLSGMAVAVSTSHRRYGDRKLIPRSKPRHTLHAESP
jgi:hypothetical protein